MRTCYIRHYVVFNESDFGRRKQSASIKPEDEKQAELELEVKTPEQSESIEEQQAQEESEEQQVQEESEEEQEVRRSQRVKKPVFRYGFGDFADVSTVQHVAFMASGIDEPTTIEEALGGDYSKQWKAAADAEYQSLIETTHGSW